MDQTNIHKPRTLLLNLGGPGRKAGVRYSYWIVTICSFLSSRDLCQNQHQRIRDRFRALFPVSGCDSAKASLAVGFNPNGDRGHLFGENIREREISDIHSFYRNGVSGTARIRISWNHWTREGNL